MRYYRISSAVTTIDSRYIADHYIKLQIAQQRQVKNLGQIQTSKFRHTIASYAVPLLSSLERKWPRDIESALYHADMIILHQILELYIKH